MSRKGKRKVKKVTLEEFIGNEEAPNLSPQTQYTRGSRRDEMMLPQGPRASHAVDVDLTRLPDVGPFLLLISNLSYDSEEDNLRLHLGSIKSLTDVEWNLKEDGRRDGTAVVTFDLRDGAAAALAETDTIFGGRKIVINVAEFVDGKLVKESLWRNRDSDRWNHDLYPQRGGWRESRGRPRYSADEGAEPGDDWRSRNHSNTSYRDHERRDPDDRDSWRSVGERDRYPSGQRYRGRGGPRYRDGESPRRSSPPGDQSPEGGRWSYSRGREDRGERRPWRGRGDGSFRRYDRENTDEPDSWRRTTQERPTQERPQRTDPESPRPLSPRPAPEAGKGQSAGGGKSIFGGAKPVDTAAREREMEEKMTRLSTRSPSGSDGNRGQNRPQREFQRGRERGQDEYRRPREDRDDDRWIRGERNDDRGYRDEGRGYRGDRSEGRGYRGDRNDDRGYRNEGRGYRGDRNDDRGYRGDRNDDRGYRNEGRGYRGDRNDDRGYGGDRRDRRGGYRDEGEGVRGPKRAPEERRGGKSAPRGTYKEQEQPEFARNTRFSLLENEDSVD